MSCQALYNIGLGAAAERRAAALAPRRYRHRRRGSSPSGRKGRVHVLERPGALVGLRDVRELSMIYPYTVVASKTATLMRITAADMGAVLSAFGGEDGGACAQLLKEFDVIATSMLHGQEAAASLRGSVAEPARWQLLQEGGARREESLADGRCCRPSRHKRRLRRWLARAAVCLHLWRRRRRGRRRRHWILASARVEPQLNINLSNWAPVPSFAKRRLVRLCRFLAMALVERRGEDGAGGSETITGAKPELAAGERRISRWLD